MTLPSTVSRPTVNFNNFDAMATSIDDSMHMQQFQQQEGLSAQHEDQSNGYLNNNNNNNDSSIQPLTASPSMPIPLTVATASATVFSSHDLSVESVMPGIYFTKNFTVWNEENLRSHGFTHIIIIDKHIQELYYPSPIFKLSTLNKNNEFYESSSPFDYFCSAPVPPAASLNFGKEFQAIDLNFGEKSYLTTVLPNCYRAVRFINKALQSGGTILVIDCNGGEQKCLTIIVAYLMYKYNVSFSNAFARLKTYYRKADLDRFYISQLYEYEPILQVQRSQSRGHSCSRELHAAILKRKKVDDDISLRFEGCAATVANTSSVGTGFDTDGSYCIFGTATTTNEFELLQTFNPLSQFNATIAKQNLVHQQQQHVDKFEHVSKQQMTDIRSREKSDCYPKSDTVKNLGYAHWDDYAME